MMSNRTPPDPDMPSRPPLLAWVFLLALTASVVAAALALFTTRPAPVTLVLQAPPTAAPAATATPQAPPTVYVSGAVAVPGVYTLAQGSRVEQALMAAGGPLPQADLARVNLAAFIYDGDQIEVAALQSTPAPLATAGGPVHINRATLDALTALPGIGPVTAQAILDYRAANGPFTTLADLDAVDGIGPATLEALAPLLVFD